MLYSTTDLLVMQIGVSATYALVQIAVIKVRLLTERRVQKEVAGAHILMENGRRNQSFQ